MRNLVIMAALWLALHGGLPGHAAYASPATPGLASFMIRAMDGQMLAARGWGRTSPPVRYGW